MLQVFTLNRRARRYLKPRSKPAVPHAPGSRASSPGPFPSDRTGPDRPGLPRAARHPRVSPVAGPAPGSTPSPENEGFRNNRRCPRHDGAHPPTPLGRAGGWGMGGEGGCFSSPSRRGTGRTRRPHRLGTALPAGRAGPQRYCVGPPLRPAPGRVRRRRFAVGDTRGKEGRKESPLAARRARAAAGRPRTCCERRPPPPPAGPAALPLLTAARSRPGARGRPQLPTRAAPPPTPTAGSASPAGRRHPPLLPAASAMSPPRPARLLRPADPRPRAGESATSPAGGICPGAGEGGPGAQRAGNGRPSRARHPAALRGGDEGAGGDQPARRAGSLGSPGLAALPVFPQVFFSFFPLVFFFFFPPSEGLPPHRHRS